MGGGPVSHSASEPLAPLFLEKDFAEAALGNISPRAKPQARLFVGEFCYITAKNSKWLRILSSSYRLWRKRTHCHSFSTAAVRAPAFAAGITSCWGVSQCQDLGAPPPPSSACTEEAVEWIWEPFLSQQFVQESITWCNTLTATRCQKLV